MADIRQPENDKNAEKYVNLEDVAEHLKVSKDAIRNWIKKEAIPHYRVGKQYKYLLSEINEWVKSGKSAGID